MTQIVIISGPPGAGKSTTADALCERYDRTVHLQIDEIQNSIRMGYIPPYKPESYNQTLMIARAASRAATSFAAELYGVFIEGVVGPDSLTAMLEELKPAGIPIHFAHLLPTADALIQRSHDRAQNNAGVTDDMLRQVHAMFASWTMPGVTIDNTAMTANQTADRVMDACGTGEALVWSP